MSPDAERRELISQLAARGIQDQRVLAAMGRVPREQFVLPEHLEAAYTDHALPIEAGQTISQPFMVALMTQELCLTGRERVLEIGTGSGYQAAVLSLLCQRVVTLERIARLSAKAQRRLKELGVANVEFHVADGSLGWAAAAPYDGIIVTAGAPDVPPALYDQLAEGGRLVIPIGPRYPQMLKTIQKSAEGPVVSDICECSFVPLVGKSAWPADEARGDG
jgi:protein-L-isoaspartate(D-aspartate) O-methyltransferase